ncbi:MAG: Flp pilus assembly protein CpaB [Chloroflexota bacterium]|nr:MAG: Flp pilus assembly protein CpaB [Chloroflexota bacterium]
MKRSNRLILLIGIFLAIVAFVGIVLVFNQRPGGEGPAASPTELPTVFAKVDIPLGVQVTADMVEQRNLSTAERDPTAFQSTSLVIGKVARRDIVAGAQLVAADFDVGRGQGLTSIDCPATMRCISVQVDQVSGVGTLINKGDYVDLLVGFQSGTFPVVTINPDDGTITPVAGLNSTSVKLLLQGMQVVGTLLPPAPQTEGQPQPGQGGTTLTGQQEIVILAVTPQQAEVIKFAQLDGSISLILRSPKDFVDPVTRQPITPPADPTTGVVLKTLVDEYGVLVPQLIEAILPAAASPSP